MNIFVSGSRRKLSANISDKFDCAARGLGIEMAERDHIVSVLSSKERTVDAVLIAGMDEQGKRSNRKPLVKTHQTSKGEKLYKDKFFIKTEPVSYQHADSEDFRLGPRVGAISSADAVLLMGGDRGTRVVGRLAMALRKPVAAIASFGGAAAEVFSELELLYQQRPDTQGRYMCLSQKWDEEQSASQILDFVETIGSRHSYFISYAHHDANAADHVELLLRRSGRVVYRDEQDLQIGDKLNEKIKSLISRSNTFILLWSLESKSSTWCQNELSYKRENISITNASHRTILMTLDKTPIPHDFEDSLNAKGFDRDSRCQAIGQILGSEKA